MFKLFLFLIPVLILLCVVLSKGVLKNMWQHRIKFIIALIILLVIFQMLDNKLFTSGESINPFRRSLPMGLVPKLYGSSAFSLEDKYGNTAIGVGLSSVDGDFKENTILNYVYNDSLVLVTCKGRNNQERFLMAKNNISETLERTTEVTFVEIPAVSVATFKVVTVNPYTAFSLKVYLARNVIVLLIITVGFLILFSLFQALFVKIAK